MADYGVPSVICSVTERSTKSYSEKIDGPLPPFTLLPDKQKGKSNFCGVFVTEVVYERDSDATAIPVVTWEDFADRQQVTPPKSCRFRGTIDLRKSAFRMCIISCSALETLAWRFELGIRTFHA